MYVGVLRLTLDLPGARSLKDKRRVVRSFKERTQNKLRLAVAEVGDLDSPRRATVGVAAIANEAAIVDEMLAKAASMAGVLREAVLVDRSSEIVPFGHGGKGLIDEAGRGGW